MAFRMWFRIALYWLLMCGLPAKAQQACDTINVLNRLNALVQDIQDRPDDAAGAFDHMHRTTLRLDTAGIARSLADHPLAAARPVLARYLGEVDDIGMLWAMGQPAAATRRIQNPDLRQMTNQLSRLLAGYPCDGSASMDANLIHVGLRANTIGVLTANGVSPRMIFGGSLIAALICAGLVRRQMKRLARRQRREKRFATNMGVSLTYKSTTSDCTIVDLSCSGAKVSHSINPMLPFGATAQLKLGSTAKDVQIVWCNAFFVGLAFKRPLSHGQLRRHLARSKTSQPDAPRAQKNGPQT